ncbi:uroporphyrinogen-III C-methyltransferase [Gilliamella sp. Pas-s95]|uniref:uroporphyrinogen-III C-methyltransferase n=1 Tax=Gilliamella sp. Pas-s95 TaxID=2687317 RepID=UPI0013666D4C|nr:uroporphyrinogen-III C-methyltransferase [Gilliamella sp. Pas-s95]
MPPKYYGANATLSTINTTSFSQPTTTANQNEANKIMKEDKKNQTSSQSTTTLESKAQPQDSNNSHTNKVPVSKLSILAIALTVCLSGIGFYYGNNQVEMQKKTISTLQTELANLKQTTKQSITDDLNSSISDAVNKQNQQFNTLEQRVERELGDQQKVQQQLSNQVNDTLKLNEQSLQNINERLAAMSTTDHKVWLISQANYLVHLAGRKIWNDQDYTSARLLLKSADESLAQADDPSLLPARQAISKDINSLAQVSFIDTDGIIINLIGLSDSLTELPLVGHYQEIDLGMTQYNEDSTNTDDNKEPQTKNANVANNQQAQANNATDNTNSEISSSTNDWSNNLFNSTKTFMDKFITIEKLDNKDNSFKACLEHAGQDEKQIIHCQILKAPLSIEQSLYLRENIRFRLLIAAQAVPRHQDLIYQRALSDTATWVNAYFDGNAPSVKAFISELETLQSQSISDQNVPENLTSISELEKLMQTRVRSMLAK